MRIWVRSDLHCARSQLADFHREQPDHDVQVLAGDLCADLAETIRVLDGIVHRTTLVVAGNHEFWHRDVETVVREARQASDEARFVRFLENSVTHVGDVRFAGATLWTDFALHGFDARELAMSEAARENRDFTEIRADPGRRFTPQDALEIHRTSRRWMEATLAAPHQGFDVVVTHHAPTRRSLDRRYVGDPTNPCYVSDLSALVERFQPALWVHGHVHRVCRYTVGATLVVCNPVGFPSERVAFNPSYVVEVGTRSPPTCT